MLYMYKFNEQTSLSLPFEVALSTKEFDPDWDKKWFAYTPNPIKYNSDAYKAIELEPVNSVQQWRLEPLDRETQIKTTWKKISNERDKRKVAGVRVQGFWFHSDDSSRIQQLALVMQGPNMPKGIQWKTLSPTETPLFVEMTPTLAQDIFLRTAMSDIAIFQAAESHRKQMLLLDNPAEYDFSLGWPESFTDYANTFNRGNT